MVTTRMVYMHPLFLLLSLLIDESLNLLAMQRTLRHPDEIVHLRVKIDTVENIFTGCYSRHHNDRPLQTF
jgi:hypothetical protein